MKKVKSILLWILSIFFIILSLSLLTIGIIPFAGLLICAILVNPVFVTRVKIKKGITFLIILALIVVSFSMVPENGGDSLAVNVGSPIRPITTNRIIEDKKEVLRVLPGKLTELTESTDSPSIDETLEKETQATPMPAITDEPAEIATPTLVISSSPEQTEAIPENRSYISPSADTAEPSMEPSIDSKSQDDIIIIDYTAVVGRNEMASIKIKCKPNTEYDCDVEYKSGPSTAKGLEVKRSDKDGYVSWTWKVGSRTSTTYRPTITITGGGSSVSVQFEVTE